ncbi:MAG: hypothetical protein ACOYYS_18255 [Chloroflexota bacterium]
MLRLEYQSAHSQSTESLQVVFDGGVLNARQIRSICLPSVELDVCRFCTWKDACGLLASKLAQRLVFARRALQKACVLVLEDKHEVHSHSPC